MGVEEGGGSGEMGRGAERRHWSCWRVGSERVGTLEVNVSCFFEMNERDAWRMLGGDCPCMNV